MELQHTIIATFLDVICERIMEALTPLEITLKETHEWAIHRMNHLCTKSEDLKDMDYLIAQPLLNFVNNQSKDFCTRFNEISRRELNLLLDLSNRQMTTKLLLEACLFRRESRGGHFRLDSPTAVPYWKCHSRQKYGEGISFRLRVRGMSSCPSRNIPQFLRNLFLGPKIHILM